MVGAGREAPTSSCVSWEFIGDSSADATVGVPDSRYRSESRSLSYTAVGFVLAILAPPKTNTRAGYTLINSARKSRRAGRIEKSTALTMFRHSSTRELQMLHTSGHILTRFSAPLVGIHRRFLAA